MQCGGNANASEFFRKHGCSTSDAQVKYNHRAATLYKNKLQADSVKAMKLYGTDLHIEHQAHVQSPVQKDVDFFQEHDSEAVNLASHTLEREMTQPIPVKNGNNENGPAPDVSAALSISPTEAAQKVEVRKSTIGTRKPVANKKALGVKKGGLGAQKVKTNFNQLEAEATARDKQKQLDAVAYAQQAAISKEEEEKRMAQARLAYQDLGANQKEKESKALKNMDSKKAAQAERLGMGLGSTSASRNVSHSAFSDMHSIQQELPSSSVRSKYSRDLDDELDSKFGFTGYHSRTLDDSVKGSSWDTPADRFESKTSSHFDSDFKSDYKSDFIPSMKDSDDKGRSRKGISSSFESSASENAQKKFGNAKSISSAQFFGNEGLDFETKQSLSRFEGSNAISSADFFGEKETRRDSPSGPDLADVKESLKQSVTNVAGKLSTLANGVMNSFQKR
ncbi:DgyrCDS2757 [Dimorphilus gyrociliatus]|nr:DgyrCDS2757 [Dimorphilus gyrociliatus]